MLVLFLKVKLREKSLDAEFFLVRIVLYTVRIQENMDQKNSVFRHFSCSVETQTYLEFWVFLNITKVYFQIH